MAGTNPYNLILQPRDRRLLAELQILRVIDREQACIIGPFRSTTRANTRLLALTRAKVIERAFTGTITGGRKAIYSLPRGRPRTLQPDWHDRGFAHQIGVGDIYLSLKYGTRPEGVKFERWQAFQTVLSEYIRLIPDGYALIRVANAPVPLFVEVDCGTEPLHIWEGKVAGYLELAQSGEFERLFGLPRFRVLVTTPGWTRCRNLARLISSKTDKIFWLTTSQAVRRRGLWADIWARPDGRTAQPFLPRAPNQ